MPWLGPYSAQHTQQSARDNSMWSDAHEGSMEQPQEGKDVNVEDPLWCGAASCAEKSFARHQHEVAKGLGHLVHNEAAIKIGGERYATLPASAGAGKYGYIPGTVIPTVFKKDKPRILKAPTQKLASVSSGNVFSGNGDSLLPHGHLWGLKNPHGIPRYHAYAGFYEGSQPDRAVVEGPAQAAGEAYGLEEKELAEGMTRAKMHKEKLMEAAKKVAALGSPRQLAASLPSPGGGRQKDQSRDCAFVIPELIRLYTRTSYITAPNCSLVCHGNVTSPNIY